MRRNKYTASRQNKTPDQPVEVVAKAQLGEQEPNDNGRLPCYFCDKDYANQQTLMKHVFDNHAEEMESLPDEDDSED